MCQSCRGVEGCEARRSDNLGNATSEPFELDKEPHSDLLHTVLLERKPRPQLRLGSVVLTWRTTVLSKKYESIFIYNASREPDQSPAGVEGSGYHTARRAAEYHP